MSIIKYIDAINYSLVSFFFGIDFVHFFCLVGGVAQFPWTALPPLTINKYIYALLPDHKSWWSSSRWSAQQPPWKQQLPKAHAQKQIPLAISSLYDPPNEPEIQSTFSLCCVYEGGLISFLVLHPLLWPPYKTPRRRRNNPCQPTPFVCCPSLFPFFKYWESISWAIKFRCPPPPRRSRLNQLEREDNASSHVLHFLISSHHHSSS